MGHGIWNNSGHASMMYVGKEPWHGLGTKLSKPATSAEAIKAAHLDWDVTLKPVAAVDGYREYPIKNRFAIVPCDGWGTTDCPVFGLVGRGYTPLQNREAFAFFDPIAGKDAAIYHTAGALGRGERIWILAKLPGHICVAGDDITEKFLLLSNSHEGKQPR